MEQNMSKLPMGTFTGGIIKNFLKFGHVPKI